MSRPKAATDRSEPAGAEELHRPGSLVTGQSIPFGRWARARKEGSKSSNWTRARSDETTAGQNAEVRIRHITATHGVQRSRSGFVIFSENTPFSFLFSFSVGKFSGRNFSGSPSSTALIVVAARSSTALIVVAARAAGARGRGPHQGGRVRAARAAPRAVHGAFAA